MGKQIKRIGEEVGNELIEHSFHKYTRFDFSLLKNWCCSDSKLRELESIIYEGCVNFDMFLLWCKIKREVETVYSQPLCMMNSIL